MKFTAEQLDSIQYEHTVAAIQLAGVTYSVDVNPEFNDVNVLRNDGDTDEDLWGDGYDPDEPGDLEETILAAFRFILDTARTT